MEMAHGSREVPLVQQMPKSPGVTQAKSGMARRSWASGPLMAGPVGRPRALAEAGGAPLVRLEPRREKRERGDGGPRGRRAGHSGRGLQKAEAGQGWTEKE